MPSEFLPIINVVDCDVFNDTKTCKGSPPSMNTTIDCPPLFE